MDFDALLMSHIGEFGTYQMVLLLASCSAGIFICLNDLDYIFSGITPPFRCNLQGLNQLASNLSFDELTKLISPTSTRGVVDACLMYQYNYSDLTVTDAKDIIVSGNLTQYSSEKCKSWIYDKEEYVTTMVTEWDLVCDNAWFVASSQSVYFAGTFTQFIGGILADKIGRKPVLLGCLTLVITGRLLVAVSPNVFVFMFSRFLLSSASNNWYIILCIFAIENVGPSKRTLAGLAVYFFWTVGYAILPGIAYSVQNWKTRNFIYLVFIVPFLFQFCFLRESARWLNTQGRTEEALDVVNLMARMNKKEPLGHVLSDWNKSEVTHTTGEEKPSCCSVFKSWMFMRLTLISGVIWSCVNAVYYGLTFYITDVGENIYINTLISALLEFASLVFVYVTLDTRLGRKYTTILLFLVSGPMSILIIFVPEDMTWLRLTFAQIGRFSISAIFSILYISTAEIFPTRIRTLGLCLCSLLSRFSIIASPYLVGLSKFGAFISPMLFGGLSVLGALMFILLPETRAKVLDDFNISTESKRQNRDRHNGEEKISKETDTLRGNTW